MGTALYQVLAGMVGQLVERVNRVPVHALRGFLEAAGLGTLPPHPAHAVVAFDLGDGRPAANVPRGTQVEAPASGSRPAIVFETDADLTVLPMGVRVVEVLDPVGDRTTELTRSGLQGAPAFAGTRPVRHDLTVTSQSLAAADSDCVVELRLFLETSATDEQLADLTSTVVLEELLEEPGTPDQPASLELVGQVSIAKEQGATSLTARASAMGGPPAALAIVFDGTLALHPSSRDHKLTSARLTVEVPARRPQTVLVNGAPVDPTLAFAALGDIPALGSELALADPVLAVPGAVVTLDLALDAGTSSTIALAWEWRDGLAWRALTSVTDHTSSLTASGSVVLVSPGVPASSMAGVVGNWIRVRVTGGNYGLPLAYVPINPNNVGEGLKVQAGTGALDAPRVLALSLAAKATDSAPVARRHTGAHSCDAYGERLVAGLGDLGTLDGAEAQALFIGMSGELGTALVTLHLDILDRPPTPRGRSAHLTPPAVRWEYLDGIRWQPLTVVDGSEGLSRTGVVSFLAPPDLARATRPGFPDLRWVRVVALESIAPQDSPRLLTVQPNVAPVTAGETIDWESLGQSDGRGSQLRLARVPVLPGQELFVAEGAVPSAFETVESGTPTGTAGGDVILDRSDPTTGVLSTWTRWQEVATFATSTPSNRHYIIDRQSGTVTFGDGVHGRIPPRGAALAATYRYGRGSAGNVPAAELARLRSAVPGIAAVRGVVDADGGSDPGSAAELDRRGPAALRHRGRAVTATDICTLAAEIAGGRLARCIVPTTSLRGRAELVVVPYAPEDPAPAPTPALRGMLERELTARAALTLQAGPGLTVRGPAYRRVTVTAEVVPTMPEESQQLKARVLEALSRFLHALVGGPSGTGWPMGRDVFESEVAQLLMGVPGVASVRALSLASAAAAQRLALEAPIVAGTGMPVGSPVTDNSGRRIWTLDEPMPPGPPVDSIVVRGPAEGDSLCVVDDLRVSGTAALDQGRTAVTVRTLFKPPGVSVRHPVASTLVDDEGVVVFVLDRPAAVPSAGPVVLEGRALDAPPLVGSVLTLVHPATLRVTDAQVEPATGDVTLSLAADVVDHLVPGAVLGLLGHPLRTPVLAVSATDQGARVEIQGWQPGDALRVSSGSTQLTGFVRTRRVLDDVVHIDSTSLVWSGPHVINVAAEG